jgi:carbon storage regulator
MLVLSRKRTESIVIGNDIVVTVVDIRGDKVRLGISAPRSVEVRRSELKPMTEANADTILDIERN